MVLGGSLFSRHSRVRFSGRTEKEVCRQPVRREQPQFSRSGTEARLGSGGIRGGGHFGWREVRAL